MEKILEIEIKSARSHCGEFAVEFSVETSLWKFLWICRKADYVMTAIILFITIRIQLRLIN